VTRSVFFQAVRRNHQRLMLKKYYYPGILGYLNKESLSELQRDIGDVERILKSLIKSLENKHLNP